MPADRIVVVEASIGGVLGGSLTGIIHLLRGLDRTRFAPELVLYEAKPAVERQMRAIDVPVHIVPRLPEPSSPKGRGRVGRLLLRATDLLGVVIPRVRAVQALLRARQPALVYLANGITANVDAALAAGRLGIPIVCHEKGFRRVGALERFASRRVAVTVAMTDAIGAHYRGLGLRSGRFVTVLDGIDQREFCPGGGAAVRREFGIPAHAPVVGIVGHIQDWKGQHVVAEAVAIARRTHPELRCLVVGGVHRQGADYAAALERRIAETDLAGYVVLTGARDDVPACLDAMDVVLHASTSPEPFGRVMIEAMALGRPVVAPREGGPVVIVVDGETGLLVPPRDAQAMAEAIVVLLDDPERRRAMGTAARARVDAVFDIRHHVRIMQALFDEILGRSRASASRAVA